MQVTADAAPWERPIKRQTTDAATESLRYSPKN